jgi:putative peptide zinc metalloprotease protein
LNDRLPEELFILVPFFAFSALIAWVLVPIGKFVRYLVTHGELTKNRARAVVSTMGTLVLMVICLGILQVPDYCRIEGIVEPVNLAIVHAQSDGFVSEFLPSDQAVAPDRNPLIKAINPALEAEKKGLIAELRNLQIKKRVAQTQEIAAAQILDEQILALQEKIARVDFELSSLHLQPILTGTWISPNITRAKGAYLYRGQQIGLIAGLDHVRIRTTAGQNLAAILLEQAYEQLEIRVKGRPDVMLTGEIEEIFPAGQEVLPSEALGYAVGGSMPTIVQDPSGVRTAEKFFEIRIRPTPVHAVRLLSGQRVIARFQLPSRSLAAQWYRSIRQLFQRRFRI